MESLDYYALLGVPQSASDEAVRAAFRSRARVHHPDRPGGDAMRFHEVYSAYRILTNPDSRKAYDSIRMQESLRLQEQKRPLERVMISTKRFVFPNTVADLAKKGLMRTDFRGRDRRMHTKIRHDLELPLTAAELNLPLLVPVPVTVRTICPQCLGSDPHCAVCDGRGSCKSGSIVPWKTSGGLLHGQIVELAIGHLRPAPLSYYKKRCIRIKITKA